MRSTATRILPWLSGYFSKLCLLVLFAVSGGTLNAQVLVNEDFTSAAAPSTAPTGWTNTAISNTLLWRFDNPGVRTITGGTPGFAGKFAIFDSDNYGTAGGDGNASLETPTFNASIAGSYRLEFDNQVRDVDPQTCEVDVWNGTAWVNVAAYNTASVGYTNPAVHTVIDISTAVAASASAKVRFHFTGNNRWWWAIDNVTITRINCVAPTATFTNNMNCAANQFSVAVNITAMGSATSIAIREGATTLATATATGTYNVGPFTASETHTLTLVPNDPVCTVTKVISDAYCPPVNDECINATTIVQSATCTNTAGSTVLASASAAPNPCSGTPDDDVWFKFVATSTDAQVALSSIAAVVGGSTDMYFQVLTGTCAGGFTAKLCSDPNTGIVGNLTVGQTYFIRVYTYGTGTTATFNICVTPTNLPAPTACGTLTAPAANATASATPTLTWSAVTNATSYDIYLDGAPTPTTLIGNTSATSYTLPAPLAGGDYYWYVQAKNANGMPPGCEGNARRFTVAAKPVNDTCSGALVLSQDPTCNPLAGTTAGATLSQAATPCTGNPDDDVWFKFVATATEAQVTISDVVAAIGTSTDMYFQVLSGTCGGTFTSLLCSDPNTGIAQGLTVGQTYFIRVYTVAAGAGATFNICVSQLSAPTACGALATPAANANTAVLPTLTWAAVSGATSYDIYLDNTPNPSTLIGNSTTTSYTLTTPLAGGDYYWYVVAKNSAGSATGCEANARKFTAVPPPANDMPAGAVELIVDADCTGALYTNVNATLAANEPRISCKGSQTGGAPVWFKFIAPPSGFVRVTTDVTGNTLTDTRLAVFSATNPADLATYTVIACDDDNGKVVANSSMSYVSGLTPGATYYVAVDQWNGASTGTFCAQVHTVTPAMIASSGTCAAAEGLASYLNTYTGWLTFTDATGKLIANVKANAAVTGTTVDYASNVTVNTSGVRQSGNRYYLDRNFRITSTQTGARDVIFYFLNSELGALQAVSPGLSLGSLAVTRQKNETACAANYAPPTAVADEELLLQNTSGAGTDISWIRVTTPGFSNFYIHGGAGSLPVTLLYFNGRKTNAGNLLNWKVTSTSANIGFDIERSGNGRDFTSIGKMSATRSRTDLPFDFTDSKPLAGINYYRIKLIDMDGKMEYTQVVAINNKTKGIELVSLQPSLVQHETMLYVAAAKSGKLEIRVHDMAGRTLLTQTMQVADGENKLRLNLGSLAAGVYNLSGLTEDGKTSVIRFVKQ